MPNIFIGKQPSDEPKLSDADIEVRKIFVKENKKEVKHLKENRIIDLFSQLSLLISDESQDSFMDIQLSEDILYQRRYMTVFAHFLPLVH